MRFLYLLAFFVNVFTIAMWTLFLYIDWAVPSLAHQFRIGYAVVWSIFAIGCAALMFLHLMQYEQSMKKIADDLDEVNKGMRDTLRAISKPSDIGPAPITSPEPCSTGFMGGCQCSICTDVAEINAQK